MQVVIAIATKEQARATESPGPRTLILALLVSIVGVSCGGSNTPPSTPQPPSPPPAQNQLPTADAGPDQRVGENVTVTLAGAGSDTDGTVSGFEWTQIEGTAATIENSNEAIATFLTPFATSETIMAFRLTVTDDGGGTASSDTRVILDPNLSACAPQPPPESLSLDPFYKKYCDADGIPVVSSDQVPDLALQWAWYQTRQMLSTRPDLLAAMVGLDTRVAIMSVNEVTTDIPEHSDLYTDFPGTDWDTRARGLGATPEMPASSAAEENILCYPTDPYAGELIHIHEFAHTMDTMGLQQLDPTWADKLKATYDAAISSGLWADTYAATNEGEYWAEGVQSWFNVNPEIDPPDGIHNDINTRSELAAYDAALYQLIAEVMPDAWQPECPFD